MREHFSAHISEMSRGGQQLHRAAVLKACLLQAITHSGVVALIGIMFISGRVENRRSCGADGRCTICLWRSFNADTYCHPISLPSAVSAAAHIKYVSCNCGIGARETCILPAPFFACRCKDAQTRQAHHTELAKLCQRVGGARPQVSVIIAIKPDKTFAKKLHSLLPSSGSCGSVTCIISGNPWKWQA